MAPDASTRPALSRARVLLAAVALADDEGLGALTMRRLAQALQVEAMSLYHHVANKEAILDGVAEVVLEEIQAAVADLDGPDPAVDWRGAMRARALAAREVLLRHPWAPQVLESRTEMSPPVIRYFDAVLGILRAGGFSWDLAHHAMHALGSRVLGFTQELFTPADAEAGDAAAEEALAAMAEELPNLVGMMAAVVHDGPGATLSWCDDQSEFEFGLDVLLDGLERRRQAE